MHGRVGGAPAGAAGTDAFLNKCISWTRGHEDTAGGQAMLVAGLN